MNNISKFLSIIISILFAISIISCGKKTNTANEATEKIFPVKITKVSKGSIEKQLHYMGNVLPIQQIMVYSTIPTKVTELNADINDIVNKGDILAKVDNTKLKQAVLQAKAGLTSSKAQFENVKAEWKRITKLYKENAVSQSQYEAVKAQKEAAEAMVNQLSAGLQSAKEQLNDTFIKAPISGIISAKNYNLGDQTAPQIPAFIIVQMEKLKLFVDIVEKHIGIVDVGNTVTLSVSSYPGELFYGKISKLYPTIDMMTRTLKTEIIIDNADLRLKPGGYANVDIITNVKNEVLIIPKHSIVEKTTLKYLGGEVRNTDLIVVKYVYVIENNNAYKTKILTGIENKGKVEVLQGLNLNDEIVTMGQFDLSDTSKIQIVK